MGRRWQVHGPQVSMRKSRNTAGMTFIERAKSTSVSWRRVGDMTTEHGKAYAIMRLSECPTLAALRTVWESLGDDYKRDPDVQAHKNDMKARMGG